MFFVPKLKKIKLNCCVVDPEERMLIHNNIHTNYESTWSKNCRGVLEKRAHTIDDFMKGNTLKFFLL